MPNFERAKPRRRTAMERLLQHSKVREVEIDDGNYLVDLMPGWWCTTTTAHSFDEGSAMASLRRIASSVIACRCASCEAYFKKEIA